MACQVGEGEPVAVAMIDVDGFKGVNDRLGHDTGDAVLVEVAQVLTDGSRHADHLLRHGGDEFLLVMPGTTPPEAHAVCERLRRTVHQHAWAAGPGWQPAPTISVGIAAIDASTGWLDAVDRADQQLLLAKAAGRNQVRPRTEPATTG